MVQLLIGGQARVQAHAEGAQPHDAGLHVRRHALRVRRLLGPDGLISDIHRDRWVNAVLAAINAVLAGYAIVAYIGVGNSIVDIFEQRRQLAVQAAARSARQARRAPRRRAHHRRRHARLALVADARLRLGGRRAPGGAAPLLASRRRRRATAVRRSATARGTGPREGDGAPDRHDRQDTIAAHTPAPESNEDQR